MTIWNSIRKLGETPNRKTLYHGDTWIYADTPTATKVDRLTISEHKESNINPKLKVGDEIIVVEVGDR